MPTPLPNVGRAPQILFLAAMVLVAASPAIAQSRNLDRDTYRDVMAAGADGLAQAEVFW